MIHFPRIFGVGDIYPPCLYKTTGTDKQVAVIVVRKCSAVIQKDGTMVFTAGDNAVGPFFHVACEGSASAANIMFDPPCHFVKKGAL